MNNLILSISPDKRTLPQSERNGQNNNALCAGALKTRPYYFLILFFFSLLTFNFSLLTYSQEAPFPTDNLQLWLRADSVELTDGKVSRWYDLSSNQYEIVQTDESARPTINESALNGNPALQFNGTSTFLIGGDILDLGSNGWTWFIVGNYDSDGEGALTPCFIGKYDRNTNWTSQPHWTLGKSFRLIHWTPSYSYTEISSSSNVNKPTIFCYEIFNREDNSNTIYTNNVLNESNIFTSDFGDISNNISLKIGGNLILSASFPKGNYLYGNICEIIAINTIDSTLRNQVYDYLYSKYVATVSLGQDINGLCNNTVSAYKPDFNSYLWNTGETDSVIHVSQSGNYSVTVTNSFGVTSTDDINVYFPEVNQLQDTTICAGDTIYWNTGLSADDYSFQWFKDGTETSTEAILPLYTAGEYTCIITDSLGCSFQTDTMRLGIDNYPETTAFGETMNYATDTSLCSGNTLGIATNIDETISYIWNTGATASRITLTESGEYSLTTTNGRGCRAENTINVSIIGEAPTFSYSIEGLCLGDSTAFAGSASSDQGIESYLWIIDNTDSIASLNFNYCFASAGEHSIRSIVRSNNSCRSDSSFNITVNEIAYPDFSYTPVCSGVPMDFVDNSSIPEGTAVDSYAWMIGDSVIGDEENLRYTFGPLADAYFDPSTDLYFDPSTNAQGAKSGAKSGASVVNLTHSILLSNGCTSDTTIEVNIRSEYAEPRYVSPAYPTDGIFVSSDSIGFSWNYDYDILYYNLITSPSADFATADTTACTSNSISLPASDLADTVYWKIVAYNHCLISHESEAYSFCKVSGEDIVSSNPNLQLWLRADSVELTDGKVSRWYDLSSNQYEIVQAIEIARPTINESVLNNNPTLQFNGTSTFLTGGDILDLGTDGWTWIIVGQYNNGSQTGVYSPIFLGKYDRYIGWSTQPIWTLGKEIWLIFWQDNQVQINFSSNITSKSFSIFNYEILNRENYSNIIYNNGLNSASYTFNSDFGNYDNNLQFKIGQSVISSQAPNGNFLDGQIAEIIAFNTIDSTLRNQVYDYLYSKYVAIVSLGLDIHAQAFCDTTITAYNPDFTSYLWSTGETDSVIHVNQPGRYTVTVTNSFGYTSTDDINVYFPEAYQLQDTTICMGDTIRWETKLPEDDYSFQWFKDGETYASTGNQIEISEAGAYNCIITDSLGCTFLTDTMQLSIDNYPISAGFGGTDGWPSISTDTTLCYGNRLHLASNYDETVSAIWQDGSTDLEYYLTQPGNYTVTTTNTRGCQAVNTINISLNGQVPTPNFSIDGHCQNAEVTATNLSTSTIGDITAYRWYANDSLIGTSENISHSFAQYGNQSLKLYLETSDNCFNDTTIYLYIDPEPVPDFAPKFFCQNAETEILARPAIAEGEIAATTWIINGENLYGDNISTTFTTAGILPVSISTESLLGCSGTRSYQVVVQPAEQPAMQIAGLCLGGGTQFTNETPFSNANPQVAWEWDFGDQTAVSTRRNPTHFYAATGDYEIKLSVSFANHCTTSIDTTVTIFAQPRASITTANGCIGGQTEMLADISTDDSISSYRWTIGEIFESDEAEPIFVADTAGTFPVSLQINTEHQCKAEATGSLNIHGELDISFNQSRTWGGNPLYVEFENTSEGASSFHWDFGGMGESDISNPYFVFTEPGSYEVSLTGTNEYGCSSMYTAPAITVVEPIVDIMLMNLATKDVNGFAQISLIVVNLGTLPVTDLVLELKVNGQLYRETMEYIAQGGVVPHTFGTMIPMRQGGDLSSTICVEALVPETDGHNDMDLSNNSICISDSENLSVGNPYPIPASEQITCDIYTKTATDLEISVFSSFGKLVKQEEIGQQKGYLKYVVSVSDLPAGMYFIRVASSDNSITYKFEVR